MSLLNFLKENWRELNCFYPVYRDGANAVEFMFEGNKREIKHRRIKSVKRSFARAFGVDMEAQRQKYGELFARTNSLPLILHRKLVLVPIKTRVALTKDDGSWGYLILNKYAGCEDTEKGTRIIFRDGSTVETLFKRSTFIEYLQCGETCLSHYKKELGIDQTAVRELEIPDGYALVAISTLKKITH